MKPATPELFIIDLDNTLYDAQSGVFQRMDVRMNRYIQRQLRLPADEADALRRDYWRRYGTTLRGLMLHHQVDAEDFLEDVHHIDAHELLQPDLHLQQTLAQLPGRKLIHTNGTSEHAERILDCLGVRHHFDAIYDIRFNHYQPKPCADTLRQLLRHETADASRIMVVDDMADNLQVAHSMGLQTCWVHGGNADRHAPWHLQITRFHELAGALTE